MLDLHLYCDIGTETDGLFLPLRVQSITCISSCDHSFCPLKQDLKLLVSP